MVLYPAITNNYFLKESINAKFKEMKLFYNNPINYFLGLEAGASGYKKEVAVNDNLRT